MPTSPRPDLLPAAVVVLTPIALVVAALLSPSVATATLPARARAHAKCVLTSARLAKTSSAAAVACWNKREQALRGAKTRRDVKKAPKCANPVALRPIALDAQPEENDTITVTEQYLDEVQGNLATLSGRIGRCYRRVGTVLGVPARRLAGALLVEWTVGKTGDPTQAQVIESGLDPLVAGCVVDALCALGVSAPPGGEPFVVELPFRFGPQVR